MSKKELGLILSNINKNISGTVNSSHKKEANDVNYFFYNTHILYVWGTLFNKI
jgi:hypothetical protein